ncbi:MAG: zinc-binding alcohol dehydrogenase [Saprospiraceae bacterium]|nr:zinc-binding alcohol dehydrogenase [Saprospiraceae bacterium]
MRLRASHSLISNGTEKTVSTGKVPDAAYDTMRVPYMSGRFEFPVKYGYSLVGVLEEPTHPRHGQRVHLLHPHQSLCPVDPSDCFRIPDNVPSDRATLASNMETALNAIWDSKISAGDRVLLVGAGLIGLLLARLIQGIPGVDLRIAEPNPIRAAQVQILGFSLSANADADFDLAFHCSGTAAGLQLAIDKIGSEGKVIELSWFGDNAVNLKLGSSFHFQRKQLISSQVSSIPADHQSRWDFQRRKETVFKLLADTWYDQLLTPLIMANVNAHFDQLRNGKPVPVAPVIWFNK